MRMQYRIAQTIMRAALVVGSAISISGTASGQAGRKAPAIDIGVTYQAVHADHVANGNSFFLQGGAAECHARLLGGLGVVASLNGENAGSDATGAAPVSLITTVFGPRYTFAPARRASVFVEALFGEASAFHSSFPAASGSSTPRNSASSFAVVSGGGIDLNLNRHFAIRAVQADWLHMQLPNGGGNTQNNLRLGAGVVVRFGK